LSGPIRCTALNARVFFFASTNPPTLAPPSKAGEIPRNGDVLIVDKYAFTVVEADERRIITVGTTLEGGWRLRTCLAQQETEKLNASEKKLHPLFD